MRPHSELLRAHRQGGGVLGCQTGQGYNGHTETGVAQAIRVTDTGRVQRGAWGIGGGGGFI